MLRHVMLRNGTGTVASKHVAGGGDT